MRIPKWRIRKKNGITLSFFFVVIAMENFSWLIPSSEYIVPSLLKFSDIGVIAAFFWSCYICFGIKSKIKITYSKLPALFVALIVVSGFAANYFFSQSLGMTLRQSRYSIVCFLMYYPLKKVLLMGKMLRKDCISIIGFQALAEIVIFILQYFLQGRFIFVYADFQTRYDTVRLRVPYLFALIFAFFCINELLNNRYKKLNIIFAVGGISVLTVLCKHRAPSMILFVTLIIAYFLWRKKYLTKFIVGIVLIVLVMAIASNVPLIKDSLNGLTNTYTSQSGATLVQRFEGQAYYIQQILKSPIVGFSEPNNNNSDAYAASGAPRGLFLADNGILGFLYCHGIFGIIWLIFLWVFLFKRAVFLYEKNRQYQYILYVIFETGNMYIGMHWYFYYVFPFILCLTLLDYDYDRTKYRIKQKDFTNRKEEL